MPRRPRRDAPGQLHHVMNRGMSRRPLFDLPSDQRRFLALIACAVRAGRIRVHAFCLMNTHYHFVMESVDGNISATMGWVQSRHSGHFNRTRGRDGPLVRGRFKSIPIGNRAYLFVLIRYTDLNPVEAGLCDDPLAYRFSSARMHAGSADRPKWLARELVQGFTAAAIRRGLSRWDAYREAFHSAPGGRGSAELVRARLHHRSRAEDELGALLRADGAGRRAWLTRRALQADGTMPGLPMADTGSVCHVVELHRLRAPCCQLRGPKGGVRDLWDVAEVGLLRDLAGQGYTAIARSLELGLATVRKRYGFHRHALVEDPPYVAIIGEVARQSLERCFGSGVADVATDLATSHLSQRGTKNA